MAEADVVVPDLAAQLEAERQARQEAEDRAAVIMEERDNYKTVALKRKGKLDNDEAFFGDHDESDIEKTVGAKVSLKQSQLETQRKIAQAEAEAKRAKDALAEVIRAQDNKPASPTGGGSEGGQVVKDSVFSDEQLAELTDRWTKRGYTKEAQERMLVSEKKAALARRAI